MITFSNSEHRIQRRALWAALIVCGVVSQVCAASPDAQAVSSDGLWRLSAEPVTHTLLLQNALGMQVRRYPWPELSSTAHTSTVLTPILIQNHVNRGSFVVAFGGCDELWEISYNPQAEDIYDGLVHDYRLREGLSRPGFLGVRRTRLEQALDDVWIDPDGPHVLGRARGAQGELQVINLDIRRVRAHLALPKEARLKQAQRVGDGPQQVLLVPVASGLFEPTALCLSVSSWQIVPCAGGYKK